DLILDQKVGKEIDSIFSYKTLTKNKSSSKGGGVIKTVHNNVLVGPDAYETYDKESTQTSKERNDQSLRRHQESTNKINQGDIITYFTGVRAPTYEEDFIIEPGRNTTNIYHVAGMQSPGLTTAPAIAVDVAKEIASILQLTKKENFISQRQGIVALKEMDDETRNEYIQKNPDYGIIICRCEEISKGEIIDALHRNLKVPTIDGIKKRVRPGMGRCQGGFCLPLVTKIISQELNIPINQVLKSQNNSFITYGENGENHE
ncbi:MAG: FAD-dependent oxidoreductase, partial [Erysipelotrichaceae bacterium]